VHPDDSTNYSARPFNTAKEFYPGFLKSSPSKFCRENEQRSPFFASLQVNCELKDVALICLCYLEHATPAQLHYASRRLRRKTPGVSILVCIFNGPGQTREGNPQQLPEGVEFLQGPLSAGAKRVCEILFQSRFNLRPDQPPLAKAG